METVTTTIAAEIEKRVNASLLEHSFETIEELTGADFTLHHTLLDEGDVVEFTDGSVYCFDHGNYEGGAYPSMEAFMDEVSVNDGVYADNSEELEELGNKPFFYFEGKVERNSFADRIELGLLLTGITRDGVSYSHSATSELDSADTDEFPLVYTTELAKHIGKRVRIKCEPGHYNAEGTSARGNPYSYTVAYLGSTTIL